MSGMVTLFFPYQTFFYYNGDIMNDIEDDFTNKIINTDILDSLYKIFDDIEETVYNTVLSYKNIQDNNNVFIMIDRELLQKILERSSFNPLRSTKLYKKSYK
jgi:hypothetical protein